MMRSLFEALRLLDLHQQKLDKTRQDKSEIYECVQRSVMHSFQQSVQHSVKHSVKHSVHHSVQHSVQHSVHLCGVE